MTATNVIRCAVAILASWGVMRLCRGRLSEPLTQSLAFWIMFLILPLNFSKNAGVKKLPFSKRLPAATAGGVVVLVLNFLFGGWEGNDF